MDYLLELLKPDLSLIEGVNYSELDIFSKFWYHLVSRFHPAILTGLFSFIYLVFLYTVLSIPWYLITRVFPSYFEKYKIQKKVIHTFITFKSF